jgi:hypothetical protein
MALWGNKDLVYGDGTVAGATFNTAGISTGNVITVGSGATFGYAVISAVDDATTLSISNTNGFVTGITTIAAGASYAISAEPGYAVYQYVAPEAKAAGDATQTAPDGYTKLNTSSVFGVDTAEAQAINSASGKTAEQKQYSPAHAGWVGITTYIDTHGRLRVKSETLVAMGKDTAGNGGIQNDADGSILADDTQFPDS